MGLLKQAYDPISGKSSGIAKCKDGEWLLLRNECTHLYSTDLEIRTTSDIPLTRHRRHRTKRLFYPKEDLPTILFVSFRLCMQIGSPNKILS